MKTHACWSVLRCLYWECAAHGGDTHGVTSCSLWLTPKTRRFFRKDWIIFVFLWVIWGFYLSFWTGRGCFLGFFLGGERRPNYCDFIFQPQIFFPQKKWKIWWCEWKQTASDFRLFRRTALHAADGSNPSAVQHRSEGNERGERRRRGEGCWRRGTNGQNWRFGSFQKQ